MLNPGSGAKSFNFFVHFFKVKIFVNTPRGEFSRKNRHCLPSISSHLTSNVISVLHEQRTKCTIRLTSLVLSTVYTVEQCRCLLAKKFFSHYVSKRLPVYYVSDFMKEATDRGPKTAAIFIACIPRLSNGSWMPHSKRKLGSISLKVIVLNEAGRVAKFTSLLPDSWITIENVSIRATGLKYYFALLVPCIQILLSCDCKIFQIDTENLNRTLIQKEARGNVTEH